MKLFTGKHSGRDVAGRIDGEGAVICASGAGAERAVLSMIEGGPGAQAAWAAMEAERVPLAEVTLSAPLPKPLRDVFCVGKKLPRPMPRSFTRAGSIRAQRRRCRRPR